MPAAMAAALPLQMAAMGVVVPPAQMAQVGPVIVEPFRLIMAVPVGVAMAIMALPGVARARLNREPPDLRVEARKTLQRVGPGRAAPGPLEVQVRMVPGVAAALVMGLAPQAQVGLAAMA